MDFARLLLGLACFLFLLAWPQNYLSIQQLIALPNGSGMESTVPFLTTHRYLFPLSEWVKGRELEKIPHLGICGVFVVVGVHARILACHRNFIWLCGGLMTFFGYYLVADFWKGWVSSIPSAWSVAKPVPGSGFWFCLAAVLLHLVGLLVLPRLSRPPAG
ncbi:MAG: hypothetical protein QM755_23060 [Luteolibacter sp.]